MSSGTSLQAERLRADIGADGPPALLNLALSRGRLAPPCVLLLRSADLLFVKARHGPHDPAVQLRDFAPPESVFSGARLSVNRPVSRIARLPRGLDTGTAVFGGDPPVVDPVPIKAEA